MKRLGDYVNQGDVIYRIYAEFPADFKFAQSAANYNHGYQIGKDARQQKIWSDN